ncbi:hypothetical protein ACLB2K_069403 [Fragaria x ananassa]
MDTDNDHHLRSQWQSAVSNNQHGHVFVYLNVVVPTASSSFATTVSSTSTASHSNSLAFIVPVLLIFVQIKFPGINMSSLFETHHATTMAAIASMLVYWLGLEARQRFPAYTVNFRMVRTVSGLISIASLLSLLLPDSWEHVPYYVLFISYCASRGFGFLRMMYRRVVVVYLQMLWLFIHYRHRVREPVGSCRQEKTTSNNRLTSVVPDHQRASPISRQATVAQNLHEPSLTLQRTTPNPNPRPSLAKVSRARYRRST